MAYIDYLCDLGQGQAARALKVGRKVKLKMRGYREWDPRETRWGGFRQEREKELRTPLHRTFRQTRDRLRYTTYRHNSRRNSRGSTGKWSGTPALSAGSRVSLPYGQARRSRPGHWSCRTALCQSFTYRYHITCHVNRIIILRLYVISMNQDEIGRRRRKQKGAERDRERLEFLCRRDSLQQYGSNETRFAAKKILATESGGSRTEK